ncbi:MAG: hypothetical protein A2V86_10810 [Deltaproteobacteria bacterium RBG_16_49_23]|nr:MAG: hypothetical protein A2V86_10810 [Deltaproteobacteria bacterium RBG_16_49_23]
MVSDPASGPEEPLARRERSLTRRAKRGEPACRTGRGRFSRLCFFNYETINIMFKTSKKM